jgi:hypothetical protein
VFVFFFLGIASSPSFQNDLSDCRLLSNLVYDATS